MPIGIASADDCPDIEVVFARGTNDAPGLGNVGGAFVDALRGKVGGRSVGAYAVNYPASFDFLAAADGANDASAHIQYMVDNCPNTRLVLGGYSQGAAVIDVISAVPIPAVGFNNPLPPNVPDHVAAIAVFGNPSAKLGLPADGQPGVGRQGHRLVQRAMTRSARPTARTWPHTARTRAGRPTRRPTSSQAWSSRSKQIDGRVAPASVRIGVSED